MFSLWCFFKDHNAQSPSLSCSLQIVVLDNCFYFLTPGLNRDSLVEFYMCPTEVL